MHCPHDGVSCCNVPICKGGKDIAMWKSNLADVLAAHGAVTDEGLFPLCTLEMHDVSLWMLAAGCKDHCHMSDFRRFLKRGFALSRSCSLGLPVSLQRPPLAGNWLEDASRLPFSQHRGTFLWEWQLHNAPEPAGSHRATGYRLLPSAVLIKRPPILRAIRQLV